MDRPSNPFRKDCVAWTVMEMALEEEFDNLPGCSDLTPREIEEVILPMPGDGTQVRNAITGIKRKTGYKVKCADERKRRNGYE